MDEDVTEAIILLENPLNDADDLVEDEVDESDVETEQIVLLDVLRLDGHDFDLELA